MRFLAFTLMTLLFSVVSFAQQAVQPTEHHELLKKEVGTWTAKMTIVMPGSDKPIVLPATETNTLISGGLWLLSEYDWGRSKDERKSVTIPKKEKYVGTWIDNSSTHLNVMEGEYEASKGELTMFFEGVDHATGKPQDHKSVTKFIDDDHRSFIMHVKQEGNWVHAFAIEYERAK